MGVITFYVLWQISKSAGAKMGLFFKTQKTQKPVKTHLVLLVLGEVTPLLDGIHVQGAAHVVEPRHACTGFPLIPTDPRIYASINKTGVYIDIFTAKAASIKKKSDHAQRKEL